MTETLQGRIMRHEGFLAFPKPDNAFKGNSYVIGYGHDITPAEAQNYETGISLEDAYKLLENDIGRCVEQLDSHLPWTLSLDPLRREALVEMVFQIGIAGVLGFHNTLNAMQQGKYDIAAAAMLDSKWHDETPERCEELANLMLNGAEDATA